MPEPYAGPTVKSCEGHIAHFKRLIEQYTYRRDEGDRSPDAESLTKWIRNAEKELEDWEKALVKAKEALKGPPPPLA